MLKHLMGVLGIILAVWGAGFLYTAAATSYGLWWDQGIVGVACWIAAALIYWRWFLRESDMPVPFTQQWHENKKYRDILDKAITTFDGQYKLLKLTGKNLETRKGINIRALGYLNGFLKAAMAQQQLDLYNHKAFSLFCSLYEKIWGVELGKRYLEYWVNAMNKKGDANQNELEKGIALGVLDFRFCASTGKQPMGWMSCFALLPETSRKEIATSTIRASFPTGPYKLDAPVAGVTDLVEFSASEYATMGRVFEGEKNYNAPAINFIDQQWTVMLQTVNGHICKISLHSVLRTKQAANPIAMDTLNYCIEKLGKPAEKQTGLFIWDTTDGNVILQTGETADGLVIALFLTSVAIRNFKLKSALKSLRPGVFPD